MAALNLKLLTYTSGNPVQGIKVQMLEDYDVDSTGGIELRPMYSEEDVLTDESGYFHIRNEGFPKETLSIGFSDIDGEENGGELVRRQGRDGYYVSVDFQWGMHTVTVKLRTQ